MKQRVRRGIVCAVLAVACFFLAVAPLSAKAATGANTYDLPADGQWMQQGNITNDNNMCYYKITLPEAGCLTIDVQSFGNGLQYQLLDENRQLFAQIDEVVWNASEAKPKSRSWSRWLEAGTYFLRVWAYSDDPDCVGRFWLKATFRAAGNQETEPNQTYQNPTALELNQEIRGLLSVTDKNDYYAFRLTEPQKINLRVTCYFSGLRVRLLDSALTELLDRDNVVWGATEEVPRIFEKEFELAAGVYYLHLDAYSSLITDRGYYDLKVSPAEVKVGNLLLDRTSMTMYKGDTQVLGVTVSPANATNKAVEWTSSDPSVVRVDGGGQVSALKAGTTTVWVSSTDGTRIIKSCVVTVKEKSLKVKEKRVTLYKGKSKTLKVTADPSSGKVTFTSSDRKIATVNSKGKITAKKKGKCDIIVKGNGFTKKVSVTVKNPELKVGKTSVSIKKGKTYTIKASVKPDGKITYRSSNKKIATVDSKGRVKAKKEGKCKIYVEAGGVKKTINVKVTR